MDCDDYESNCHTNKVKILYFDCHLQCVHTQLKGKSFIYVKLVDIKCLI